MRETSRLCLLPCTGAIIAAVSRPSQALSALLGAAVPEGWPQFPDDYRTLAGLWSDDEAHWWVYIFLSRDRKRIIGSGGYKGPPREGSVEIGYEIAPEYRRRGYATEAAHGLVLAALEHPDVRLVCAHTHPLPRGEASIRVLQAIGFEAAGTADDPQEGEVLRWEFRGTAEGARVR